MFKNDSLYNLYNFEIYKEYTIFTTYNNNNTNHMVMSKAFLIYFKYRKNGIND